MRGLPAKLWRHVRTANCAARGTGVLLQARFQCGWRAVAGRVRGRSDSAVVAGGRVGRSRAAHAQMRRKGATLCHVLGEVRLVSAEAVGSREVHGRRHHGVLVRRRCCQRRTLIGHVITVGASLASVLNPGSCKCCRSSRCSLFDSTGVLVLMTCESSAPRKGLLAISVRALVRTSPRMSSSVSGQGAAVAE